MIARSDRFKQLPVNIVGSSTFGRYPKISREKTLNMFISDGFMVPYAGYQIAIPAGIFGNAREGRGCHVSIKLNRLIAVFDDRVYEIDISFNQMTLQVFARSVIRIGTLQTSHGVVYISENNNSQVVFSDNQHIYFYDPKNPGGLGTFQVATIDGTAPLDFIPGYIDFHDTYILAVATNNTAGQTNTWRLGVVGTTAPATGRLIFPTGNFNGVSFTGALETKPDNTRAIVRFPSHGNMIMVLGETVGEPWFDTGAQRFPYQRNNQYNIDYGCVQPATVASLDQIVCWLAQNEKSGPIIVYSTGGPPEKITTDGIDYLFSNLTNPEDSQGFLYRQDGHLFYHLNFYTDNLSLFYDFNTQKFYHASDQNYNYFIASEVAFFNNQYYFTSKNDGNLYVFDTIFTNYSNQQDANGKPILFTQPRERICKNIRDESQQYFIANDIGFTIESGETNYQFQDQGPLFLITEDGKFIITEGADVFIVTQAGDFIELENGSGVLLSQQVDPNDFNFLIDEHDLIVPITPAVDLSISIDGGANFGSDVRYNLPAIGLRKNRLMWWRLGVVNDLVPKFKFWSLGRIVCTDGQLNIRQ